MYKKVNPRTYECSVTVPEGQVRPLFKLSKGIIRAELTYDATICVEMQRLIRQKEELLRRLYFLKKFGFPYGCVCEPRFEFVPYHSIHRAVATKDGRRTDYAFNGIRYMTKQLKMTAKGWQVEFIYRD